MQHFDHDPTNPSPLKDAVVVAVNALADACKAAGLKHVVFAIVAINADADSPASGVQVASNLDPDKAQEMFAMLAMQDAPSATPLIQLPN